MNENIQKSEIGLVKYKVSNLIQYYTIAKLKTKCILKNMLPECISRLNTMFWALHKHNINDANRAFKEHLPVFFAGLISPDEMTTLLEEFSEKAKEIKEIQARSY